MFTKYSDENVPRSYATRTSYNNGKSRPQYVVEQQNVARPIDSIIEQQKHPRFYHDSAQLMENMDDKSISFHSGQLVDMNSVMRHEGTSATNLVMKDDLFFTNHYADASFTHCHRQVQPHGDGRAAKTLIFVSVLTLVFIIVEFTGGFLANSLAIMTDAGHMLSDLLSFLISLFAIYVARKPATMQFSFGYHRAQILGALCSILIIWILTGVLVYMAIIRVVHDDFEVDSIPMIITATVAIIFNIIMGAALHFGGHGHSHFGGGGGHSHGGEHEHNHAHGHSHQKLGAADKHNTQRNINIRAAFIHVLGDLLQSVGVLITALIINFTGWKLADPICTFFFAVLVLATTLAILRDTASVLMEGIPKDVNYIEVKSDLEQIKGVRAVHSLHIWSLTIDKAALAVHLAIDPTADALMIVQQANWLLQYKYNMAFNTVQVEPFDSRFMISCNQCIGPLS